MEFKRLVENKVYYGYYNNIKLSNGQTAAIFFFDCGNYKYEEYSIVFVIANKKKEINDWLHDKKNLLNNHQTGKCGLEGLIWAKRQLIGFEKFIIDKKFNNDIIISIYWTDNKRRDVYEKALSKIGYYVTHRNSCKCMIKKIKK